MNEVYQFLITFAGIVFTIVLGCALLMYLMLLVIRGEVEQIMGTTEVNDENDDCDTIYSKETILRGIKGQRDKLNRFIELAEKAEFDNDQLLFLEDDFDSLELVTSTLYQTLNNDVEKRDSLDNYLEP